MLTKIIEWSGRNPFLVLLATLFIVIAGVVAVVRTPLDALPDLSDVQVIVYTEYPGQAPQVVEDQVTYPLTTAMLSVPKSRVVRGGAWPFVVENNRVHARLEAHGARQTPYIGFRAIARQAVWSRAARRARRTASQSSPARSSWKYVHPSLAGSACGGDAAWRRAIPGSARRISRSIWSAELTLSCWGTLRSSSSSFISARIPRYSSGAAR